MDSWGFVSTQAGAEGSVRVGRWVSVEGVRRGSQPRLNACAETGAEGEREAAVIRRFLPPREVPFCDFATFLRSLSYPRS